MIYSEHTSKITSVFLSSNPQVTTCFSNINQKIKTQPDDTCKHLLTAGEWHNFNWNNLSSTKKNFNKYDGMKLRQPVIRRMNEPGFWTYSGEFYTTKCNYHWYTWWFCKNVIKRLKMAKNGQKWLKMAKNDQNPPFRPKTTWNDMFWLKNVLKTRFLTQKRPKMIVF